MKNFCNKNCVPNMILSRYVCEFFPTPYQPFISVITQHPPVHAFIPLNVAFIFLIKFHRLAYETHYTHINPAAEINACNIIQYRTRYILPDSLKHQQNDVGLPNFDTLMAHDSDIVSVRSFY